MNQKQIDALVKKYEAVFTFRNLKTTTSCALGYIGEDEGAKAFLGAEVMDKLAQLQERSMSEADRANDKLDEIASELGFTPLVVCQCGECDGEHPIDDPETNPSAH